MQELPHTIAMDEPSARRIVLARAIEAADSHGRMVSEDERSQADQQAADAARSVGEPAGIAAISRFLSTRSAALLQAVARRDPAVASLQDRGASERWTTSGLPLAALVLGIFTDQVANPHQVNLLSKPLLVLLLWNAVVYLLLLANLLRGSSPGPVQPQQPRQPRFAGLRLWVAGLRDWRRRPGLRGEVTAAFLLRWHALSGNLYGRRLARVMHLSAAAWALGVALSLFFGGVWASYGVQWESTFLSATDVHRFLSILFKPVTALFPWASFSLDEVRALRAGAGPMPGIRDATDNVIGRRWVFLYAALLAMVIVLPRLLLAAYAWWREKQLAEAVRIDLDDEYFQRLLARLSPARIRLGMLAHRAGDRTALLRVLRCADAGAAQELLTAASGESLLLLDLEAGGAATQPEKKSWLSTAFSRRSQVAPTAGSDCDVVLHIVSDPIDLDATPGTGKPVLLLVNTDSAAPGADRLLALAREQVRAGSPVVAVLGFDAFARCWVQESALLDAVARAVPQYRSAGFARLAKAWDELSLAQLRESMTIVAAHLLGAARQLEDLGKAPRSLVSLVRPGERDAHERRSRDAMAAVVERLQRSDAQATSELLVLHGIAPSSAGALNHQLEQKFVVRNAISASQAGAAGAAAGATMGVSIDLLTAGLTLGLAAAAGAVVGGGAAWVAAVWKNNATPAGNSVVQLSDDMLQAMVEAALLRYLAVIHFGRGPSREDGIEVRPAWRSEVVAAVERRGVDLREQWLVARSPEAALDPAAALVAMLESITLAVLKQLYPATPAG